MKPAGPERASVTFTVVVTGAILSFAGFKAPGVAEQVSVVPAVSLEKDCRSASRTRGDSGSSSETVHDMTTSLVYQPWAPDVPETDGVITGGIQSAVPVHREEEAV